MSQLEIWGPTIATIVIGAVLGTFTYFYTGKDRDRDEKLSELIEANSDVSKIQVQGQFEMVKGLHELSTAVSLLKQAFEHITVDSEKKHVELLSYLNRHDEEIEKLRTRMHALSNDVQLVKFKSEYKITQ